MEEFGAVQVGLGRIGQGAIVEDGEGLADGGVFWVGGLDEEGGADAGHGEDFGGGFHGKADAAVGAGVRFDKAPVHAVGRFPFHPIGHGVAGAGLADAAFVSDFGGDAVVALAGEAAGADGAGGGEEDATVFDDVNALGAGGDFDYDVSGVPRAEGGGVEVVGDAGFIGRAGGAATGDEGAANG